MSQSDIAANARKWVKSSAEKAFSPSHYSEQAFFCKSPNWLAKVPAADKPNQI